MKNFNFTKNQWIAIISLVIAAVGLLLRNNSVFFAPQSIVNSPSSLQVQGSVDINVNVPTIFKIVKKEESLLPDGRYQIALFVNHLGENPVSEFTVKVLTNRRNLDCDENKVICFQIEPPPSGQSLISEGESSYGVSLLGARVQNYSIKIILRERLSSIPKIVVCPSEQTECIKP